MKLEPDVDGSMRASYAGLRARLSAELHDLLQDEDAFATISFIQRTGSACLDAQILRCQSAVLAQAAAQLEPASASQQRTRRPSRRSMQGAADVLQETAVLLNFYLRLLLVLKRRGAQELRPVRIRFLSELHASYILEHWSRLLLLLAGCEGWEDKAAKQLHSMANTLTTLAPHLDAENADWGRSLLLSGPSLAYLLSSHVVGLCAALDGGPTYGMPGAAVAGAGPAEEDAAGSGVGAFGVAPVFGSTGLRLRQGAPEGAGTRLARLALGAWRTAIAVERRMAAEAAPSCADPPPPPAAVAVAVAVAGGDTGTDRRGPTQRQEQQRQEQQQGQQLERDPRQQEGKAPGQQERQEEQRAAIAAWPIMSLRGACQRRLSAALCGAAGPGALTHRDELVAAAPPLHTAATFELCMRLAATAAAAMTADAAAACGPGTAAGSSRGCEPTSTPRPRIPAAESVDLAVRALECGREALGREVVTAAAALSPTLTARLQRWWAAVVAVVDANHNRAVTLGLPWATPEIVDLLAPPMIIPLAGLPPSPSPCVAAALDAGYLPRLAHMLRSPALPERCLWQWQHAEGGERAWDQLLAFGPPHETAAVVRAFSALLRAVADDGAPGSAGPEHGGKAPAAAAPALRGGGPARLLSCVTTMLGAKDVLYQLQSRFHAALPLASEAEAEAAAEAAVEASAEAAVEAAAPLGWAPQSRAAAVPRRQDEPANTSGGSAASSAGGRSVGGDGGAAAEAAAAGLPRLGLMLPYVIAHVGGPMFRVLYRHLPAIANCPLRVNITTVLADCLEAASLVAAALHRASRRAAAAAAADGCAAADSHRTEAPAADEWRSLLMESLGLPSVLGLALGLMRAGLEREGPATFLAWSLSILCAFAPAELRAALLAPEFHAASEAAAAAARLFPTDAEGQPSAWKTSADGCVQRLVNAVRAAVARARGAEGEAAASLQQSPWDARFVEDLVASCGGNDALDVDLILPRTVLLVPPSRLERMLG